MKCICHLILLLFLLACESTLFNEEEQNYQVIDSEEELEAMLNGIYLQFTKVYNQDYFELLGRSDDVDSYPAYTFPDPVSGSCSNILDVDYANIAGNLYLFFYKAIVNTNRLLPIVSEAKNPHILGELYFLRAYSYFKLAQFFGTPPLVTDTDVDYFIEKPTYEEVYLLIESDMIRAIALLPSDPGEARIPGETPHLGTAKALLAEIYLSMAGYPLNDESKYAEAARLAGEVISNASGYNYELLADFANLWNEREYRHNSECVFGLFFDAQTRDYANTISASRIGQLDYYNLGRSPLGSGNYVPDITFFHIYPNSYRKYNSFIVGEYKEVHLDSIGESIHTRKFEYYDPLFEPCDYIRNAFMLKWMDLEAAFSEENGINTNNVTLYLLRYAQTLLTYAEAKARSGELDASCYEAVNQVRRRAHKEDITQAGKFDLTPNLTTEEFIDSVVWERAWELCMEPNGRWFDIIRLNMRDELESLRHPIDVPTVIDEELLTPDWYFFKIPQEDRWLNPNFGDDGS